MSFDVYFECESIQIEKEAEDEIYASSTNYHLIFELDQINEFIVYDFEKKFWSE